MNEYAWELDIHGPADLDGDGRYSLPAGGTDCDDEDGSVHPGADCRAPRGDPGLLPRPVARGPRPSARPCPPPEHHLLDMGTAWTPTGAALRFPPPRAGSPVLAGMRVSA